MKNWHGQEALVTGLGWVGFRYLIQSCASTADLHRLRPGEAVEVDWLYSRADPVDGVGRGARLVTPHPLRLQPILEGLSSSVSSSSYSATSSSRFTSSSGSTSAPAGSASTRGPPASALVSGVGRRGRRGRPGWWPGLSPQRRQQLPLRHRAPAGPEAVLVPYFESPAPTVLRLSRHVPTEV